jgi:hypothetical protein
MNLPRRVFLDTNVVNFVLDYDGCIFENETVPSELPSRDKEDVEALRKIFATGERAMWELAVSPRTYLELSATSSPLRRRRLEGWFREVWDYWMDCLHEDEMLKDRLASPRSEKRALLDMLTPFPDATDRDLIRDAIAYECDAFCTRDHKTIIKRRERVPDLPIAILSPREWWLALEPHCNLWL